MQTQGYFKQPALVAMIVGVTNVSIRCSYRDSILRPYCRYYWITFSWTEYLVMEALACMDHQLHFVHRYAHLLYPYNDFHLFLHPLSALVFWHSAQKILYFILMLIVVLRTPTHKQNWGDGWSLEPLAPAKIFNFLKIGNCTLVTFCVKYLYTCY